MSNQVYTHVWQYQIMKLFCDLADKHKGLITRLEVDYEIITLENDNYGKTQTVLPCPVAEWARLY